MVFKHNEQPFAHDDSCQIAYKHLRQLDCGGQLASFAGIPEKQPISDGEREGDFFQSRGNTRLGGDADDVFSVITHKDFEKKPADIPNATVACAVGVASSLSWITSCSTEVFRSELGKRPFSNDISCQVAVKRVRQADQNSHVDSSEEIASFCSTSEGPPNSVAADEELRQREAAAVSGDSAKNAPISVLSSPFTCSTTEEGTRLEPPVRLSFFPGYFEDGHRTTGFNQPEEIYSPIFDYPRKLVAIGPNHQADVPVWRSQDSNSFLRESDDCNCASSYQTSVACSASADHHLIDEDNSDRLIGTCVMPMPDSDSVESELSLEYMKTECSCPDEGSVGCVRDHVMEAREKLKNELGPDRFIQLGFCNMGEEVALKWTEDEEQLFLDVVLSNPASLGKNFWDELCRVFPSRSSKELVSYYFNVFILRRRAEQNRSDPLNVDSDDDEWQDSDGGEFATTEDDDEDSAVESPVDQDDVACNNGHEEEDIHEEAESGDDCDDCSMIDKSNYATNVPPADKNPYDGGEDQDVHDDSCTSYEVQHTTVDSCVGPVDFVEGTCGSLVEHGEYISDGLCCVSDHDYIGGHCDPKAWEIGYTRGIERDVDFLPTCNVIEEVFGKGSWENEARDGHGII